MTKPARPASCKHPKTWRVSVSEHGMMLVEWCARCGAFKRHAVAEPCHPGCIDAEIEAEREEERSRGSDDSEDDEHKDQTA